MLAGLGRRGPGVPGQGFSEGGGLRGPMRGAWVVGLGVALLLVAGTAIASEGDLEIALDGEGTPTTSDPSDLVTNATHEPPERYAWELDLSDSYHIVHVRIDEGFPIEEGRQLVPLVDDRHFVQTPDVADVDRAADVFNLTAREDAWRYDLGLTGPGEAQLTLTRDRAPPAIEIVSVGNHTDVGFDVTTDTSERAEAELFVHDADGELLQTYPTPPGPWQGFPVQGLEANTSYQVHVEARDWSRNTASTETITVTTEEDEDPPKPLVEPVRPMPNATVSGDGVLVEASVIDRGWPIEPDGVTVFFDKERVDPSRVDVGEGTVTFRTEERLESRAYAVGIEVPNTAGGVGIARWSFHVEEADRSAPGPAVAAVLAASAGMALAARRL